MNRPWVRQLFVASMLMTTVLSVQAAENCKRGEYYFNRFVSAGDTLPARDGVAMLERAVEVCSRWEYWQKLGETAEATGDRGLESRAAEAYVEAYEVANTDEERALSAGHYGELLLDTGNPQKALTYIHHARNLKPDDPWLDDLATRVNAAVATVDPTEVKRGLGDALFKPLQLNRTNTDQGSGGAGTSAVDQTRAVNVPIQFEVNSVRVNDNTRRNIAALAESLADPVFDGESFLLIGHADTRGEETHNLMLSRQRAEAIRSSMLELEPSLNGRLQVDGQGAAIPLSNGTSDEDHQINRRLEVVVLSGG